MGGRRRWELADSTLPFKQNWLLLRNIHWENVSFRCANAHIPNRQYNRCAPHPGWKLSGPRPRYLLYPQHNPFFKFHWITVVEILLCKVYWSTIAAQRRSNKDDHLFPDGGALPWPLQRKTYWFQSFSSAALIHFCSVFGRIYDFVQQSRNWRAYRRAYSHLWAAGWIFRVFLCQKSVN